MKPLILQFGKQAIDLQDYLASCAEAAKSLKDVSVDILPQAPTPLQTWILYGACFLAQKTPILTTRNREQLQMENVYEWNFSPELRQDKGGSLTCEDLFATKGPALKFLTSGSTGKPKTINKTWHQLILEANQLAKLFKIDGGCNIVSLVPPLHIFGFLYSYLLPLLSKSHVYFTTPRDQLYKIDSCDTPHDIQLLITVPTLWPVAREIILQKNVCNLISSGAAFGDRNEISLKELGKPTRYWEVLGSTETGGIGYREMPGEQIFKQFEGVEIRSDVQKWQLMSPFATTNGLDSIPLSDSLEIMDDHHFRHLGRSDQIFKYGSKPYSMNAIQTWFEKRLGIPTICEFIVNTEAISGGELTVYLESESDDLDYATLKSEFQLLAIGPFPKKFHFLKKFPKDENGKTTLALLSSI